MLTRNLKTRSFAIFLSAGLLVLLVTLLPVAAQGAASRVKALDPPPAVPGGLGFGGAFAGVSNGVLLLAGGTNFPEAEWGAGEKVWYDDVYVLEPGGEEWKPAGRLPEPNAYGVSITCASGLLMVGGSSAADRALPSVLLLQWTGSRLVTIRLPDLPAPRATAAGALLGGHVYVAGGQAEGTTEQDVTKTFWRLSLPDAITTATDVSSLGWEELEAWPGAPRFQAAGVAQSGRFHLISGIDLMPDEQGEPTRDYLKDCWAYDPGANAWTEIAPVPRPAVAAAPAIDFGDSHLLVISGFGGENAELVEELKADWPGFSPEVLAYHTITDTWTSVGEAPFGIVTAPVVLWQGDIVAPTGEVKPRIRAAQGFRLTLPHGKGRFGTLNMIVLGVYLASLVAMGFYFAGREKSTEDFFVGGRRVPWWAAGVSIFATQLSSISFMAIPAKVYATDWLYFTGVICIVLIQPIVVFFYLPFFRRLNVTSAYEYLEKRFNVAVRVFGSLSFMLFQLGRMTIVLFLPALALAAVTGMNIYVCIVLMGVLATFYTVLGGIEAVVWTDFLQVIVLVGGAILSFLIVAFAVPGGLGGIFEAGMQYDKFKMLDLRWDYTATVLWVLIIGNIFGNMISYSADQAVIQRYLVTKNERTAAGAIWTNAALVIPISLLWYALGSALWGYYRTNPGALDPTLKTDQIFPLFIAQQLPDGIAGLVIAGLFAASMSTLDSSLNSIATAFTTDFYKRFRPEKSDAAALRLARWLTLILGIVGTGTAMVMAYNREAIQSLWDVYTRVLGLLMGSLCGVFMLGIFTRRANGVGGLVGAITGAITLYLVQRFTDVNFFLYSAIGVGVCFVVGYAVSLVVPDKDAQLEGLTAWTVSATRPVGGATPGTSGGRGKP